VRLSALRVGRDLLPNFVFWYSFLLDLTNPRGLVRLEGLGKLKKFYDFIGTLTSDLPAYSIVPQPTTLPRAFIINYTQGVF
jgi:hypothetical protein